MRETFKNVNIYMRMQILNVNRLLIIIIIIIIIIKYNNNYDDDDDDDDDEDGRNRNNKDLLDQERNWEPEKEPLGTRVSLP